MRTTTLPHAGRRYFEVAVELQLDDRLGMTYRIILGSLASRDGPVVICPTDQELADQHGVSLRTAGGALAAGVRAGWIWRGSRKKMKDAFPGLLPRAAPRARRYIVLLWRLAAEPAGICLQPVAGPSRRACSQLPAPRVEPAASCRPLACAPVSASSEERTREERTFVSPSFPPEDPAAVWPDMPVRTRESFGRMMAAAAAAEAAPGYVAPPAVWEPPKPKPSPTARMKVEELVAACLGPDRAAGLNALLLWLATELHDSKPMTRAFWSRSIADILASADGFDWLVEAIVAAKSKRFPSHWFSKCVARGQPPGAQKEPTPGASWQASPGVGQESPFGSGGPSEYKYTREAIP